DVGAVFGSSCAVDLSDALHFVVSFPVLLAGQRRWLAKRRFIAALDAERRDVSPVQQNARAKRRRCWLPHTRIGCRGKEGLWWSGSIIRAQRDDRLCSRFANCDAVDLWLAICDRAERHGTCHVEVGGSGKIRLQYQVC